MSAKDIAPYKGKRRKLLEALANAENADDGVDQICRKAGISRSIYYKYIDELEFRNALKSTVERTYARFAPQIANSVSKEAKKGNIRAADLIHKVLGYIESGNRQTVNVGVTNEPTQVNREFATPADALAAIEQERLYLDQLEQRIRGQIDAPREIGEAHAIHPDEEATTDGKA